MSADSTYLLVKKLQVSGAFILSFGSLAFFRDLLFGVPVGLVVIPLILLVGIVIGRLELEIVIEGFVAVYILLAIINLRIP